MRSTASKRLYYEKNRQKITERAKRFRLEKPEHHHRLQRKSLLRQRYGITPADYEWMLLAQGGVCAVCKSEAPNNGRGNRYFDVDHDHKSGKVRGLLCRQCNVALGHIEKILRNSLLASSFKQYLKG